jgi:hypothetical protein
MAGFGPVATDGGYGRINGYVLAEGEANKSTIAPQLPRLVSRSDWLQCPELTRFCRSRTAASRPQESAILSDGLPQVLANVLVSFPLNLPGFHSIAIKSGWLPAVKGEPGMVVSSPFAAFSL